MTDRQLLEQEIAEYKDRVQQTQDHLERLEAKLDALPKERVRLRAEAKKYEVWIRPVGSSRSIATVWPTDCNDLGFDPAALTAHICRFGEPDVSREMEALEAAVRDCVSFYRWDTVRGVPLSALSQTLTALDAARNGGA